MKNKIQEIIKIIKHYTITFITPSAWASDPYCKYVDYTINSIMKDGEYVGQGEFTAVFNYNGSVVAIWIRNYPYSYGSIWSIDNKPFGSVNVPFIQTRKKLNKLFKENNEINKKIILNNLNKEKS